MSGYNQDTVPCDHITCINRIPRDEYMIAQESIKERSGQYGFVTCNKCTPAPEGHWLHELATMPIDDLISMMTEALDEPV